MRHVQPHRWADALAGKVGGSERAQMECHADDCRRCARARDKIKTASGTFPTIRAQSSPELAWDHVRARVHWSVSTERRAKPHVTTRLHWLGLGLAAAGLVATVATGSIPLSGDHKAVATAPAETPQHPVKVAPAPDPAPAALTALVSRAAGDVMVDGIRPTGLFDRELSTGAVLATGDGRVDVQFGDASAFALGARSTLELRRFDAKAVELVLSGTIDLEVAPRAADQRFVVVAGDRSVVVRGTAFRVTHDGKTTTVACRHGLVVVRDAKSEVAVAGGRRVEVKGDVAAATVTAMTADELAALGSPVTMALWTPALAKASAPLEILTSGHRDVRVDGVELGVAPLRVRVTPGRHTVEAADGAGRFRHAGWVDVNGAPARLEIPAEVAPTGGVAERRKQLLATIDHARLNTCTRRIAKQGLAGGNVQFSISVDGSGAVGFLNIIGSDLPSSIQACVKEVLQNVTFKAGPAATWRERLDL